MPATERVFWRTDSCTVWVGYDGEGALIFSGLDRKYLDGYEYEVTVAPGQFGTLQRALSAGPDDHGIERGFSSY